MTTTQTQQDELILSYAMSHFFSDSDSLTPKQIYDNLREQMLTEATDYKPPSDPEYEDDLAVELWSDFNHYSPKMLLEEVDNLTETFRRFSEELLKIHTTKEELS